MKIIKQVYSKSIDDSIHFAKELAGLFRSNDIILMQGDIGTGKTFLVKEICKIWQTADEPSSPSFVILNQYRGRIPVNHFDLYRIDNIRELDNLGWEDYLYSGAVTFIEWPSLIENQLSSYYKLELEFENHHRQFTLKYFA